MKKKKVGIIGAGLAGMNCARLLQNEFDVTIFDKNPRVGGRILSSQENNCILDHGFQVFLPSYPEAKDAFDIEKLDLRSFAAGAFIRRYTKFYKFSDPLRNPSDIISTLLSPIASFKDKLLILKLKNYVKKEDLNLSDLSTIDFLHQFGFSEKIIYHFFVPFFSGVFLERELKTNAHFFCFLFNLFANSHATIPLNGMEELPKNLSKKLTNVKIHLNTNIELYDHKSITVNGRKEGFDYVICAFNPNSTSFRTVTTDYFLTSKGINFQKTLLLNGEQHGLINHIAFLNEVSESYGPKDKLLLSVNLLSPNNEAPIEDVQEELQEWFPNLKIEHLKRFTIQKALPANPFYGQAPIEKDDIFYCGDQMQDPSINGALKSGRMTAEKIKYRTYQT